MSTLTKETLASLLNGREYGSEIDSDEEQAAKASGLVVIYGYSDDNVELRGAIYDEIGAYEGRKFRLTTKGVLPTWSDQHEERNYEDAKAFFDAQSLPSAEVYAAWGIHGYSWFIATTIPHATFDIMESSEKFCRGIVIDLAAIAKGA